MLFWYLLGCSASKGLQRDLLRYLVAEKKVTGDNVVSELVPLRGEKHFKPCPQNRILVRLRGSFQNFRLEPPSFLNGITPLTPPPPPGIVYNYKKVTFAYLFFDQVPLAITDLKESLQTMQFTAEDLIHLDELKKCFENDNLSEVKESQIHVLGKLNTTNEFCNNKLVIFMAIKIYVLCNRQVHVVAFRFSHNITRKGTVSNCLLQKSKNAKEAQNEILFEFITKTQGFSGKIYHLNKFAPPREGTLIWCQIFSFNRSNTWKTFGTGGKSCSTSHFATFASATVMWEIIFFFYW